MRLTDEQVMQDNKRFANCNALAELKHCGWDIPHRKSITNDNIHFYAWLCRSAVAILKEQEAEGKWIYGEDETGVDGWHCSECGFFEPWFYEFTDDIDFIRFYGHCPKCGRRMTSYTGKPTQERR